MDLRLEWEGAPLTCSWGVGGAQDSKDHHGNGRQTQPHPGWHVAQACSETISLTPELKSISEETPKYVCE